MKTKSPVQLHELVFKNNDSSRDATTQQRHDEHSRINSNLGLYVSCAASAGAALLFLRKHKQTKSNPSFPKPPKRIPQPEFDGVTAAHQAVLFLKELVPVLLHSDKPANNSTAELTRMKLDAVGSSGSPSAKVDSDVPTVHKITAATKLQQGWQLCKAAVNAWIDDFAPSMGAAIAYYTMFSIAPMLVIAIAVAGFIFGQEAAQGEIVAQIRGLVGTEGAIAIQGLLKSASEPAEGIFATVLSLVTLAIGSTAVFAELQSALDRIWRVPAAAKQGGLWNLIRTRLLSFGLILGLGFMLMVSLVVSATLAALGHWWGGWFEGWEIVVQVLNLIISFFVFAALFAVIYKFMPRVSLSWRDVWIGAVVTTILFIVGKYLIGLYLGTAGVSSGFGAAGSFALLLAWIYYSAQIFLLGAEFTWIYANNFGSKS